MKGGFDINIQILNQFDLVLTKTRMLITKGASRNFKSFLTHKIEKSELIFVRFPFEYKI